MEHLSEAAEGHELLSMVRKHEENGIVCLGREFKTRITELLESSNVVEGTKKIQKEVWIQKETHGYHQKQIENQDNIDVTKSNNWLSIRFTSHMCYARARNRHKRTEKEKGRRCYKEKVNKQHM